MPDLPLDLEPRILGHSRSLSRAGLTHDVNRTALMDATDASHGPSKVETAEMWADRQRAGTCQLAAALRPDSETRGSERSATERGTP
jgi:hypothetical protein